MERMSVTWGEETVGEESMGELGWGGCLAGLFREYIESWITTRSALAKWLGVFNLKIHIFTKLYIFTRKKSSSRMTRTSLTVRTSN